MKSKRGFLLAEETLKIVIAVICIGFLVYLLTSLYLKNKDSKDLELAKASLEHLVNEINLQHTEVEIYNPKGWVIGVWPHDTNSRIWYTAWLMSETKKGLPKYCENLNWNSCICICKKNDKNKCDELGYCLQNNLGLDIKDKSIEIDKLPIILEINNNLITKK